MLEIVILWVLGKKVADMCRRRGRTAWPWVVFLVLSWYGGALAGGVVAAVAYILANPGANAAGQEPPLPLLIAALLGGAVIGVTFVTVGVSLLPPVRAEWEDDEDDYEPDEEPAPRRARRVAADDPYAEHDRRYRDDEDEYRRR